MSSIKAVSTEQATVAEEEYLESLFWLHEVGLPKTGANLSRAMQLSAPTVHEMVRRLENDGYITRAKDKVISFTAAGEDHARSIVSRHRLVERYLTDIVGVPWNEVHEEAESLEHNMSPRFEAYIRDAVGDATTCPHGHPIETGKRIEGVPLADVEVGAKVTVLRLENEAEDLLNVLMESGVEPGLEGTLESNDEDAVCIKTADGIVEVTPSVAATVSVLADPSPPPRVMLPDQLVLAVKRYGR